MNNYIIIADSACDLPEETLKSWEVPYESLTYLFTDDSSVYGNYEKSFPAFYADMRAGRVAKTQAVNADAFSALFRPYLEKGLDILYLGFSSGLSTTYNSSCIAASDLIDEFPDRKILTVDTLAASTGFGLLVYLAVEEKKKGKSIEEVAQFVEDNRLKLCHWFTVDDLVYLKRGGRISPTVAFVGNMLQMKPVLHVDDEGHLINITKVRGRKTSIKALADKYDELALDKVNGTVMISHGDCIEDAELLASILKERHGVEVKIISYVGPVIGAHSGPGTLALFFLGEHR